MEKYVIFIMLFSFVAFSAFSLELTSSAFKNSATIPILYTGLDKDISPPLSWSGIPDKTESFALIMDDPDAPMGTWVHWVIYNIPKSTEALKEGISGDKTLEDGSRQGKNSFGRIGYGGPYPPRGPAHRYVFTLYALDTVINLVPGADKQSVLKTIKGHMLAEAQLIGKFGR